MKNILLTGTLLAAMGASPVLAADSAIILWNTSDPAGFETASGTGSASVLGSSLDGVTISVSSVAKSTSPNDLTEDNINISNTTGSIQTIKIIAGANGYLGTDSNFSLTGTIGATLGGSDLVGQYFVAPTNTLNGLSESVVGSQLNAFNSGALFGPQSFSFNGSGLNSVTGPFGMAEELTLTLQPHASVFVQGLSMTATSGVPEPGTWAMLLAGFGLVGALGLRKRRVPRFAV